MLIIVERLFLQSNLLDLLYSCGLILNQLVYLVAFRLSLRFEVFVSVIETSQFAVLTTDDHRISVISIITLVKHTLSCLINCNASLRRRNWIV